MTDAERLARWMIKHCYEPGEADTMVDLLAELARQITEDMREVSVRHRAHEREECAKVCEALSDIRKDGVTLKHSQMGKTIAAAIRARGNDE